MFAVCARFFSTLARDVSQDLMQGFMEALSSRAVALKTATNSGYHYETEFMGKLLQIKVSPDFPESDLYKVFHRGEYVGSFNDLPAGVRAPSSHS